MIVDRFLYYNEGQPGIWRCSGRKKHKCKRLCREVDGKIFVNSDIDHTHQPLDDREIKLMKINSDVKEKSMERPDDKPFLIITSALKENNSDQIVDSDFSNFRQNAYRAKRKVLPNHPKSKAECISALKDLSATPGSIIRNVTDDIVMVARADDLRLIPAEGAELYADGTFQYAPRFFKQMYSFSIFKDGFYVPIVHFLLQNKTSKTYKKCTDILLDECSSVGVHLKDSLKIGHVMIDFEVAIINAIKEKLECNLFGCRFHLGQSWQRQIGKKGLATHYTTSDSPQGKWLRGLFELSLVPSLMAKNVFERYCKTTRGRSDELLLSELHSTDAHQ